MLIVFLGDCDDGFSGSILHDGHIFEVKPLNQRIKMLLKSYEYDNHEKYHIMTKKPVHELPKLDEDEFPLPSTNMEVEKEHEENEGMKYFVNNLLNEKLFDWSELRIVYSTAAS